MSSINLLEETFSELSKHGKTIEDVNYIVCQGYLIPIVDYEIIANCTYNNGYGSPVVNVDLKIVGEDWWLERAEYDGSEWFEFKEKPQIGKCFEGSYLDAADLLFGGDEHLYNDIEMRIK